VSIEFESDITVQCSSDGSTVLGCGMNVYNQSESFPGFWAADSHTCKCHNIYGATCYAICAVV
jgi:hypothetical protein